MALVPFVQKVDRTIKRHGMIAPREPVLVGVSGGADSVCLTRVLHALGYPLGLAHVDHRLRGQDSEDDARFVEQLARSLGVTCYLRRVEPGELTGNLEAAARTLRRAFFREVMGREGYRRVALAHSRDDRVETFLLHLLRGSGASGLVSMQPVSDWLIRPLIGVTRAEIEAHLAELGQDWRIDATNRDNRFARNRIRHDVIPRLRAEFNPNLEGALTRTIEILSDENDWLDREARRWVGLHFSSGPTRSDADGLFTIQDHAPRLRIGTLPDQPPALVRRVLRTALAEAGSDLRDVGFDHLEQVRRLLGAGKSGRVVELPGERVVERSFGDLVFRFGKNAPPGYAYRLEIPGQVEVAETGYRFEARRVVPVGDGQGASALRVRVDGASLGPYVKIRNWNNGDTYEPVGHGRAKLKTLFQQHRIPRFARSRWPVLVAGSSIVWVASFPVSREFVPTAESRTVIELEAFPTGA